MQIRLSIEVVVIEMNLYSSFIQSLIVCFYILFTIYLLFHKESYVITMIVKNDCDFFRLFFFKLVIIAIIIIIIDYGLLKTLTILSEQIRSI